MFRTIRYTLYGIIILAIAFGYWFLPKYAYIHNNPGSCTEMITHVYYCGNNAGLETLFDAGIKAEAFIRK